MKEKPFMKKKGNFSNIVLFLLLLVGLSLLLYPSVSDWWNSRVQTRAVASYTDTLSQLQEEDYSEEIAAVNAYNKSLIGRYNAYLLSDEQKEQYNSLLNLAGDGIMAIVEIPTIDLLLPIYHGTEESVLQVAVGHLEWTSLPIGGKDTHCVVSSHRGLPSARLFTDIDQLTVGDHFYIRVLNEQHCYEVDQIAIVEPNDTKKLLIEEGKDLVTLVTCTPYGVNSHRLLVRGHRISPEEEAMIVRVTADAMIVDKLIVAPFVLLPLIIILLLWVFFGSNKKGGSHK